MSDSTRDKIIQAALDLFSSDGFRKTTTRKIAAAAGVNESTLFRTFDSKVNLYREVLSLGSSMTTILQVLDEGDENADLSCLLERVVELYAEIYKDYPKVILIFLRSALDREEMDFLEQSMGPGAALNLQRLFERKTASGTISLNIDAEQASFLFLSLIHGVFQRGLIFRKPFQPVFPADLVNLFLNGVVKHEECVG